MRTGQIRLSIYYQDLEMLVARCPDFLERTARETLRTTNCRRRQQQLVPHDVIDVDRGARTAVLEYYFKVVL